MTTVYGNASGTWFTDGCGCYDASGKCFCAECYFYGADHVNCADAGANLTDKSLRPYKWDVDAKKWVEVKD